MIGYRNCYYLTICRFKGLHKETSKNKNKHKQLLLRLSRSLVKRHNETEAAHL